MLAERVSKKHQNSWAVDSMDDGRHEAIARLIWIATRPSFSASALFDLVDELLELLPESDRRSAPFDRSPPVAKVLRLAWEEPPVTTTTEL